MTSSYDSDEHSRSIHQVSRAGMEANQTFHSLVKTLDAQGINETKSFAILALDMTGNVQIHTSSSIRPFLDEFVLGCEFRKASDKAIREASQCLKRDVTSHAISDECGQGVKPILPHTSHRLRRSRTLQDRTKLSTRHDITMYEPIVASFSSDSEDVPPVMPDPRKPISFRICEEDKVVAFLQGRLKRMQQLADKKIAKAWIKGICPKKQAKFPYQNHKRAEQTGQPPPVPAWWPDTVTMCRFTEPDHIKRDERMRLCLHLLRLRPSPATLREWNGDPQEPSTAPMFWPRGWTGFLRECAGDAIFAELPKESRARSEQRRNLLRELYEVAELEERFWNGEIDKNYIYQYWEDDDEKKLLPIKRTRSRSVVSVTDTDMDSRESSVVAGAKRRKRTKQSSTPEASVVTHKSNNSPSGSETMDNRKQLRDYHPCEDSAASENAQNPQQIERSSEQQLAKESFAHHYAGAPLKEESSQHKHEPHHDVQWQDSNHWALGPPATEGPTSMAPSHASSYGTEPYRQPFMSNFVSSRPDYGFTQYQNLTPSVQAHQATHIPEPQFQVLRPSSAWSPSSLVPTPIGTYLPPVVREEAAFSEGNSTDAHQNYAPIQHLHPQTSMPYPWYQGSHEYAQQTGQLNSLHDYDSAGPRPSAWHHGT